MTEDSVDKHSDLSAESASSSWFERLAKSFSGEPSTREDVLELITAAHDNQLISTDGYSMIKGVFDIRDIRVRDVMVPRGKMSALSLADGLEDNLRIMIDSQHSRYPVFAADNEQMQGVLITKDLMGLHLQKSLRGEALTMTDFTEKLRKPMYVSESMRLLTLLHQFRQNRIHMAIVMDEFDGIAGLIAMEDILEKVVGNIEDEHDEREDATIVRFTKNLYTIKADTALEEVNETLDLSIDVEYIETIGGYVAQQMGRVPQEEETLDIGQWRFRVIKADSRRAEVFQVKPIPVDEQVAISGNVDS